MQDYIFYFVFFSQIVLISFYYPRKMLKRFTGVLELYPPKQYPKLYTKPIEYYWNAKCNFKMINLIILFLGMFIMLVLVNDVTNDDFAGVVIGYFFIQFIPMILIEIWSFKYYKNMREADVRKTKTAVLQPRRFFNFVSPVLLVVAIVIYVAFIVFVFYVRQFNYPWFGGYLNIAILTAGNLFFVLIILWNMYGKKRDPYQAYEDRVRQIKLIVKQLMILSIVMTIFTVITIILRIFDLHSSKQLALSLYLQLIAVISFQALSMKKGNFDVYKADPDNLDK